MYSIIYTSAFKKDFKNFSNNQKIVERFKFVIDILSSGNKLPDNFRDHKLK